MEFERFYEIMSENIDYRGLIEDDLHKFVIGVIYGDVNRGDLTEKEVRTYASIYHSGASVGKMMASEEADLEEGELLS